jgi:bla regulator protein blaR1
MGRTRGIVLLSGFLVGTSIALLHGQAPPRSDATLVFETASVKPNQTRNCDRDGTFAGGRFVMTCSTLHALMIVAFPRADGRARFDTEFAGGPSWINTDHFDVIAKVPEGQGIGIDAGQIAVATAAEASGINRMKAMLRALLADRFKLATHNERRDLPVYELHRDRNDGTLGPQLKKIDIDCVSLRGRGRPGGQLCGGFRTMGPGHIIGGAVSMSLLAQYLEMPVSRNVLDRTGLQGTFDLELQYAPDRLQPRGLSIPAPDPSGVLVFTALREQLGLKLYSTKAPVNILVIDHVERPTPD